MCVVGLFSAVLSLQALECGRAKQLLALMVRSRTRAMAVRLQIVLLLTVHSSFREQNRNMASLSEHRQQSACHRPETELKIDQDHVFL